MGDTSITWAFEENRWASIRQLTARELEIHSRPEAIATHRIQLRFYPNLSVKQRFLHKGEIFNIISFHDEWDLGRSTIIIASKEVT
jgi:head-tail adaptor